MTSLVEICLCDIWTKMHSITSPGQDMSGLSFISTARSEEKKSATPPPLDAIFASRDLVSLLLTRPWDARPSYSQDQRSQGQGEDQICKTKVKATAIDVKATLKPTPLRCTFLKLILHWICELLGNSVLKMVLLHHNCACEPAQQITNDWDGDLSLRVVSYIDYDVSYHTIRHRAA